MRVRLDKDLQSIVHRVDDHLAELAPRAAGESDQVGEAIRYSLLAPGKRLRPLITVLLAEHLGGSESLSYYPACAIEMVHTASLIVDDLPAMDNATMRRSRSANHLVFGEDVAVLASFALVSEAFTVLGSAPGLCPTLRLDLVTMLSKAIGPQGIIGGQLADLHANGQARGVGCLKQIHDQKTGALFVAAAEFGARVAGLAGDQLESVRQFATKLGLAYQARDELIDALGTPETAGKDVGSDVGKPSLPALLGIERASLFTSSLLNAATHSLAPLGPEAEPLARMIRSLFSIDTDPAQIKPAAGSL